MIELAAFVLFGIAVVTILVAFTTIVKALFWLLLLPVRLVFWLVGTVLMLPFLLIKGIVGGLAMVLVIPAVAIAGGAAAVALVAVGTALLVPLIPLVFLAALIWFLIRPERALARG